MDHDLIEEIVTHLRFFRNKHKDHKDYNELIKPFEVTPTSIPASGILNDPRLLAPEKGYVWMIMRITVQGFTAGSVTAFKGNAQDTFINTFANPSTFWFQNNALFITNRGRPLTFTATGITGNPMVSVEGLSIREEYLGKYLAAA